MNRQRSTAAAAMLMATGLATVIHAQGPGGPPAHGFDLHFGPDPSRLAARLGLSDEQQAQIEAMRDKHRETLRPLMESARQADRSFRSALQEENPDATAVGQAALAMHAARQKLQAAHEAAFEEMGGPSKEVGATAERTHLRHGPGPGLHALNIPLSRVPERQSAPRRRRSSEIRLGGLAVLRAPPSPGPPDRPARARPRAPPAEAWAPPAG